MANEIDIGLSSVDEGSGVYEFSDINRPIVTFSDGTSLSLSLLTSHVAPLENDLSLCGAQLNLESFEYAPSVCGIAFPVDVAITSGELTFVSLQIATFNRESDFDLCQYNPTTYDQNFEFKSSYDFECEGWKVDCFDGSQTSVELQGFKIIGTCLGYDGSATTSSISTQVNLYPACFDGSVTSAIITAYPSVYLSLAVYDGSIASCQIETTPVFSALNARDGSVMSVDITPTVPITLTLPCYDGSVADVVISTYKVIGQTDFSSGEVSLSDLTTFVGINLAIQCFDGTNVTSSLYGYSQFYPQCFDGSVCTQDLTVFTSPDLGSVIALDGSETSAHLSITTSLGDCVAFSGEVYAQDTFTTTIIFEIASARSGEVFSGNLTANLPDLFVGTAYTGDSVSVFLNGQALFYPRLYCGEVFSASLSVHPSFNLPTVQYFDGSRVDIPSIEENTFFDRAYSGEVSTAELYPATQLPHTYYAGDVCDVYVSSGGVAIDRVNAFTGERLTGDLTIPERPSFGVASVVGGESASLILSLEVSTLFKMNLKGGELCFDSWGGEGGINLCESVNLSYSSQWDQEGDTIIRFDFPLNGNMADYRDYLVIDFTDHGEAPWNPCNQVHSSHLDIDLSTRVRFSMHCYGGETSKAHYPTKYLAFGNVPEYVLYQDSKDRDLSSNPDWLRFFSMTGGESGSVETLFPFDVRLCPGYIVPTGDSVVFDFGVEESTSCDRTIIHSGDTAKASLSCIAQWTGTAHCGDRMEAALTIYPILRAIAWSGENLRVASEARFTGNARGGERLSISLYEEPILAFSGESATADIVFVGPSIEWVTNEGCLINNFAPDVDGNTDQTVFIPDPETGVPARSHLAVEELEFYTQVLAKCVSVVKEDN